jgi:transposase
MPRPHTTMRHVRDVLRLRFAEGLSLRQVARSLSMAPTTVADYVARATNAGLSWPLPEELGDDDALERQLFTREVVASAKPEPDFAVVRSERAKKGVTSMLLWLEWKEVNPDGYSYSAFCRHYQQWRRHVDVVLRQDHQPGELFVDFPGMTIPIYDERTLDVAFGAELFVAVLGVSNYLFAEALVSQGLEHWISGHVRCFEFLNGAPTKVVPDNLKSGVSKPHPYEPDLNATYQEMARHYGTVTRPRSKPACNWPSVGSSRCCATSASPHSGRSMSESPNSWSGSTIDPSRRWRGRADRSSRKSTDRPLRRCPPRATSSPPGNGPG